MMKKKKMQGKAVLTRIFPSHRSLNGVVSVQKWLGVQ